MTDTQITTTTPTSVFITGAVSPLGREVTRQLVAAGHQVTGAVSSSADAVKVRADGGLPAYPDLYRAGELRSAIQAASAKVVLNLAPQSANHLPQYPAQIDERLADATAALMDAALEANIEFVVHTSYAFADAHADDAAALLRWIRAAERAALKGDVPACVLRFGFLYGADSPELGVIRAALKLGRPMRTGSNDTHANWVYAVDAATAVVLAMLRRPAGAVLNIVDDQPASPAEFLRHFAQSQGFSLSGGLPFLRGRLSKSQLAIMNLDSHVDNAAAQEQLGWSPRFPSYRQGIDDLLLTWRAQEQVVS